MNENQKEQIIKHGENLNRIFHLSADPIKLCKSLRRLETQGNKLTTDYANGDIGEEQYLKGEKELLN